MDIPLRAQRPAFGLPEIFVQDSNPSERFRSSSSRSTSHHSTSHPMSMSSGAMSIPNSREPVPPPLPPPRVLADIADGGRNGPDLSWRFANAREEGSWGASPMPGSSLYGGRATDKKFLDDRPEKSPCSSSNTIPKPMSEQRRGFSTGPDEGYASLSGTSIGSNRCVPLLQSELSSRVLQWAQLLPEAVSQPTLDDSFSCSLEIPY